MKIHTKNTSRVTQFIETVNRKPITVNGFKAGGVACGIKKGRKKDLALIYSETPVIVAGVFTKNKIKAASVILNMEKVKNGICNAIIVNSGNANACTGKKGVKDALKTASLTAKHLAVDQDNVMIASTGVIGNFLPMDKIKKSIPNLVKALSPYGWERAAEAIMTTDTYPKLAIEEGRIGGKQIKILGIAKGSGMIAPNMATMLSFLVTDAAIGKGALRSALKSSVALTFNKITIDGDCSTNDMVIALANGIAANKRIGAKGPDLEQFKGIMKRLCLKLAHMIVKDGEGATKSAKVMVKGAKTPSDAHMAARAIAESLLVKTALFGEDANWGRMMAALGHSGADIDPDKVRLSIGRVPVVRNGSATGKDIEASKEMKSEDIKITVDLKMGSSSDVIWTSDISYDYVKINASYRS